MAIRKTALISALMKINSVASSRGRFHASDKQRKFKAEKSQLTVKKTQQIFLKRGDERT